MRKKDLDAKNNALEDAKKGLAEAKVNADAAALAEQQKKVDAAQKEYSDAFDALIAANSKLDELTADYQKKSICR